MKRILIIVVSMLALVAGCSSTRTTVSKPTAQPTAQAVDANGCHGLIHQNPSLDRPGCYAVSTMKPGQPFDTTPNFFYFKECGRPCWLPLYPRPIMVTGRAVTRGEPCEYYELKTGSGFCQNGESQVADSVHVVCQVRSTLQATQPGQSKLVDDAGHRSNIWDQVYVPSDAVVGDVTQLRHAPGGKGYLAYGADLWLENTGWHGIPCPPAK